MTTGLLIGQLASKFGVSPQAIRYYEQLGLLNQPYRNRSGYRLYTVAAQDRLYMIRSAQNFGLSLHQIKEILDIGEHSQNSQILMKQMVQSHLAELDQQLAELDQTRQQLKRRFEQFQQLSSVGPQSQSLLKLLKTIEDHNHPVAEEDDDISNRMLAQYAAGERYFSGIKLIGAKLSGTLLSHANFNRAELMLASLNETVLEKCTFREAYLSGADMIGAYLEQADLSHAVLVGSDLSEATLAGASLIGSNLGGACLYKADLRGATLSEAILMGANLQGADLRGVNLFGSNLLDANLEDVIVDEPIVIDNSIIGYPQTIP
ncbi:pentapeptide repeat-containing protein [Acaryochloris sp. IP29b_bin.148]|uniref:pentapeptide repeat-containing protein n=1 Tax=Acaryochloris sp. IP29b_bin.148 TaxID=2969218 RepID=UPI002611AF06|nr:pentapeptide repeat-containing protein [Acaryochloris sp. IP29b_bin.148]